MGFDQHAGVDDVAIRQRRDGLRGTQRHRDDARTVDPAAERIGEIVAGPDRHRQA